MSPKCKSFTVKIENLCFSSDVSAVAINIKITNLRAYLSEMGSRLVKHVAVVLTEQESVASE